MKTIIPLQWRHNGLDSVSNHQPHDCLLNRLSRLRSKKTWKLRVTGLCAENSPVSGEFPAQSASNAENASIWWRQHVLSRIQAITWSNVESSLVRFCGICLRAILQTWSRISFPLICRYSADYKVKYFSRLIRIISILIASRWPCDRINTGWWNLEKSHYSPSDKINHVSWHLHNAHHAMIYNFHQLMTDVSRKD